MSNSKEAKQILSHPDFQEILGRMLSDIPPKEIWDWLKEKYPSQKQLIPSQKALTVFRNEYMDFYSIIREDLLKKQIHLALNEPEEDSSIVKNNKAYQAKLAEYLDKEIDIRVVMAKLVAKIEHRSEVLFDQLSANPNNAKIDKTIVDYLNLLFQICQNYQSIYDGPKEQVNIQNNISIQMVDTHINLIQDTIREILTQLDYESSLLFTELFTKKLAELRPPEQALLPVDKRLEGVYSLENQVTKFEN